MSDQHQNIHTYIAEQDGQLWVGRGNPDDPKSLASDAFASVELTPAQHNIALAHMTDDGELTRGNAAVQLGNAAKIAIDQTSQN